MKTLLEITQDILSDMSSDNVNSIFDTEESEQVARIVVATFNAMVTNTTWPSHRRLAQLTSSSDNLFPTYMTLVDDVKELCFINYDKIKDGETKKAYVEINYKSPDDFLRFVNHRDSTAANVQTVVDPTGVELFIIDDKGPDHYTSFDDNTIVFDSFDSDVESTLVASKVQAMAYIKPSLALLDTSVPDIPVDAEVALVEEATSRAQYKLAEFQDVKSEQESGRQKRWLSRRAWRTNPDRRYPNYGKPRV